MLFFSAEEIFDQQRCRNDKNGTYAVNENTGIPGGGLCCIEIRMLPDVPIEKCTMPDQNTDGNADDGI